MGSDPAPSTRPLYSISVAAELAELAVPTLRLYEQHGLVRPARTGGGTRRYSDADIQRLRRIAELVDTGVTLAAVGLVLDLQDDNEDLTIRNQDLSSRNTSLTRDNRRLRQREGGVDDGPQR